jgi:hypothetical protein
MGTFSHVTPIHWTVRRQGGFVENERRTACVLIRLNRKMDWQKRLKLEHTRNMNNRSTMENSLTAFASCTTDHHDEQPESPRSCTG